MGWTKWVRASIVSYSDGFLSVLSALSLERQVHISTCRRIPIRMGTKSLTITDEAYDRLKEHKRDDESFTDTILRLTGNNRDVLKGFGAMKDVEGFREAVEETRDDLDADLRERADR